MDRDHLLPEDFPGYDWELDDHLANEADAANDERWLEENAV